LLDSKLKNKKSDELFNIGSNGKQKIFGYLDKPDDLEHGFFRFYFAGWVLPTENIEKLEIRLNGVQWPNYSIYKVRRVDLNLAFPNIPNAENGGYEGIITVGNQEGSCNFDISVSTENNKRIEIGRKVLYNTKNVIHNPPSILNMGIISRCNLSCKMCPKHSSFSKKDINKPVMDEILVEKIIDQLRDFSPKLKQIEFQDYGEPFLYKDIFLIANRIANILPDCIIHMNTNGNLLNEELIDKIINSKIHSIAFSLDAGKESTYKKIRIGGDFSKVISNIKLLVSRREFYKFKKPYIVTNFVIMRSNLHELSDYINLSESLNVDGIGFIFPFGLFESDKNEVLKTLFEEENEYSKQYSKIKSELEKSNKYYLPNFSPKLCMTDCSHGGKCSLYIDTIGDVYPCCVLAIKGQEKGSGYDAMGNIKNQSLQEIGESEKFVLFREKFYRGKYPHEICKNCPPFYGF